MSTYSPQPLEYFAPKSPVIIVFGPPLLGRAALARALERRLPDARRFRAHASDLPSERISEALRAGLLPIIEGDFCNAHERRQARARIEGLGATVVFVEWLCDPTEARREIYHRYARLPRRYADRWWQMWETDSDEREPTGEEIPERALVSTGARGSVLDHVVRVAAALGIQVTLPSRPRPPRRVLVVDDDDDARDVMAEALETLGCEVHRASCAKDALDIASKEPLDLVLTDQQMPGATGTELAEELASHRPDVRVALITGYAEETVDVALDTSGVELLFSKPISGSDLIRVLDELADASESV